MVETAVLFSVIGILTILVHTFTSIFRKREWGENTKRLF